MEDKYYLAVETKPNSYFPINLGDLSITNGFASHKLEEIDKFTLNFTKNEIIKAIKDGNILDVLENMNLVIIYNEKEKTRKVPVLTKDINFDMWKFLKDNYNDKLILNKIHNFLQNKIGEDKFKNLKNTDNCNDFVSIINTLPYDIERKLYFYLYEK
ncbi:MAG: hypothetical protein NC483_06370 [Ruminococcus sp.]|nr:hypothetical protein [Ruminococcus sp.]